MGKESMTRVVLADDHDVVRQGLKRLLDRAPEIEVVGEASNGLEALRTVEELQPDVLLLDIEMPVMDGIEVARRLQQKDVEVQILVLSAYDDREYISALFEIGVSGYLIKGVDSGKIVEAVRGIVEGKKGLVSSQVRKKLEKMHDSAVKRNVLNYDEVEILHWLSANTSKTTIARQLGMDENELDLEIQHILRKLNAPNWQQAVEIAKRNGWL